MELPKVPDFVKVCEIFLVPSSFMVAALGTADTNLHRAAVSALGLIVSTMWLLCSQEALSEMRASNAGFSIAQMPRRLRVLALLPWVFILGWTFSLIIHVTLWNHPLGVFPAVSPDRT